MNILVRSSDDVEKFITLTLPYVEYRDDETGEERFIMFQKLDEVPDEFKEKTKKLKAKMKLPDFGGNNDTFRESTLYRPDGIAYTNLALYKRNTIKRLLKEISTVSETVAVNEENFHTIDPTIADHIYQLFNDTYLNPIITLEELGKKII